MRVELTSPDIASLQPLTTQSAPSGATGRPAAPSSVPDAVSTPVQSNPAASAHALQQAVDRLNAAARENSRELNFAVDPDSKKVVIRIVNQVSAQVLYQIPSEDALRLASSLKELSGILFDHKV